MCPCSCGGGAVLVPEGSDKQKPSDKFRQWWEVVKKAREVYQLPWSRTKAESQRAFSKALRHSEIRGDVGELCKRTNRYLNAFRKDIGDYWRRPVDPVRFLRRELFTEEELRTAEDDRAEHEQRAACSGGGR